MAIPRVTHWSTMATALSPGRSTVSSQCLCKYDTALAFRAFKHSLKTRKGQKKKKKNTEIKWSGEREERAYRWKGCAYAKDGTWLKLLRLVFNLQFVRRYLLRSFPRRNHSHKNNILRRRKRRWFISRYQTKANFIFNLRGSWLRNEKNTSSSCWLLQRCYERCYFSELNIKIRK